MDVVIFGSRDFNDYELLKETMEQFTEDVDNVISGMARGADSLGIRFAEENGIPVIEMPADWDTYGKSAGYRRNEEMAKIADYGIGFWDGTSRGTKHMIDLCKKHGVELTIIRRK